MFLKSRKYFFLFLSLMAGSTGAILWYLVFSLFSNVFSGIYAFLPFLYYPVAFIMIYAFKSRFRIVTVFFVSIFSLIVLSSASVLGLRNVFHLSIRSLVNYFIFTTDFLVFLAVFFLSRQILKGFNRIDEVIENEKMFENRANYIQWLSEQFGEHMGKLEPFWFTKLSTNLGIVFLILCFISIAKNEYSSFLLSIFLLIYSIAVIGIYLILNQYISVIKWRFLGIAVKKEVIKNWNKIIRIFLLLLVAISIIIPSNYVIIKLDFLSNFLSTLFPAIFSPPVKIESPGIIQDFPFRVKVETGLNSVIYLKLIRIFFLILSIFFSLSLIAGFIFSLIFRDRKNIPFLIKIFITIWDFFKEFLLKIFLAMKFILGIFFPKRKTTDRVDKRLKKHLYNMFGDYKKLSSEKQKEIELIIREFIRLIDISSRFVIPYAFYYGPKEYMEMVSEKINTAKEEIKEVVNTFNESRYSNHLLSDERKKKFRNLINFIIDKITSMV